MSVFLYKGQTPERGITGIVMGKHIETGEFKNKQLRQK